MRDEHQALSCMRQAAHRGEQLAAAADVETDRGLVEDKRAGMMDERAGDDRSAHFAGGHLLEGDTLQMRDVQVSERAPRVVAHRLRYLMVRPYADASEEPGGHRLQRGGRPRAFA